ncbi:MAG UNVERIFIED_CONTAM: HlyD family secretion protein [Planctomycetaceae bacterium]|jgi:biotin carboxyl carrier protein
MLHDQNNISLEKFQEIERKLLESEAKVREETANVSASKSDLTGKQSDRLAYIQKAAADVSYYEGALDKALSEVAKAEKEQAEMQSKVARQSTQIINAPFDGYVVEFNPNMNTQLVKEGDPICVIVPDTKDLRRSNLARWKRRTARQKRRPRASSVRRLASRTVCRLAVSGRRYLRRHSRLRRRHRQRQGKIPLPDPSGQA